MLPAIGSGKYHNFEGNCNANYYERSTLIYLCIADRRELELNRLFKPNYRVKLHWFFGQVLNGRLFPQSISSTITLQKLCAMTENYTIIISIQYKDQRCIPRQLLIRQISETWQHRMKREYHALLWYSIVLYEYFNVIFYGNLLIILLIEYCL